MKKVAAAALSLFLALAFYSSGKAQEVKIIGGVQVIQNGKKPIPLKGQPTKIRLAEELTIGQEENPDESFSVINGFVVASDGTIFVLDSKDRKVKVFASSDCC